MNVLSVKPCKHDICGCKIDDEKTYCSDECSRLATDDQGKCACGHSDCVVEAVLQQNEPH